MRKLLFLFVAAATVVFSSCSKDDNNDGIQLTKTDLVGVWNVTSIATSGDFSNVPSGGILISVKNDDSYTVKFFSDMYVGRYEIKRHQVLIREKIKEKLGITSRIQFNNRRDGIVNHTPAERDAIEAIFNEFGVTAPWGKE